jgi:hypothetical protein
MRIRLFGRFLSLVVTLTIEDFGLQLDFGVASFFAVTAIFLCIIIFDYELLF